MIYSMTSFASTDIQAPLGSARWEIRSLNHRYLELNFKLPEMFRDMEWRLRDSIRQLLQRGKVDCVLRLELAAAPVNELMIDHALVDKLILASQSINQKLDNPVAVSSFDILRWPSVVLVRDKDLSPLMAEIEKAFTSSIQALLTVRAREGEALKTLIHDRLTKMSTIVLEIAAGAPKATEAFREKIMAKVQAVQGEFDQTRFEQEMIYLASKTDVAEEIDRLHLHIKEVDRILSTGGTVGRRLDFLMQELNRESNTLASKLINGNLIQKTVTLKVLIEEMREQIQNLE